ncbi:hypothetical protein [Kribbella capetownensis]|nr:hypothetical protein [Kribbella capetownensis]
MTTPPSPSIDPEQVLPVPQIDIVLNDDRPVLISDAVRRLSQLL